MEKQTVIGKCVVCKNRKYLELKKNGEPYACCNTCRKHQETYQHYNKTYMRKYQAEYRELNKDKITEQKKGYYQEHKREISQKNKEYYYENKDKYNVQTTCECGSVVLVRNMKEHQTTKKHLSYLSTLSTGPTPIEVYIDCECGSRILKQCKSKHIKTIKHRQFLGKIIF